MAYKIDIEKFTAYISSCLGDPDENFSCEGDLIQYFKDRFSIEFLNAYHLNMFGTPKKCLVEWLKGLPSCISVVFYSMDIINLYKQLEIDGSSFDDLSEVDQDSELDKYFTLVAEALNTIYNKHFDKDIY